MPISSCFVLKDSHPAIQEQLFAGNVEKGQPIVVPNDSNTSRDGAAVDETVYDEDEDITISRSYSEGGTVKPKLQGRMYNTELSKNPGGYSMHDMTYGAMYAFLSITDDTPDKLQAVAKSGGPWHVEAMKLMVEFAARNSISGQQFDTNAIDYDTEVNKPLSYIMETYFNIKIDHIFDVKGWKGGHVIDTQGYIGHNDNTIILAYQCTANANDWLANFTSTTSVWETEDIERGHSGALSGLVGFIRQRNNDTNPQRGRVHTGFYNYFIASVPAIQQYIDPLLEDTSTPKTFYIVGHSLGGGIAHMALIYFLLEYQEKYDWNKLGHRLVLVTAGSPRAYTNTFQGIVDDNIAKYPPGTIQAVRLVRDDDAITVLPPPALGFAHTRRQKWIFISTDGAVLINPNRKHLLPKSLLRDLLERYPSISSKNRQKILDSDPQNDEIEVGVDGDIDIETSQSNVESSEEYKKKLMAIPKPLRDHMPEYYLKPLMRYLQEEIDKGYVEPKGVNQEYHE
jgi:pimeloyl-ACP methyl ester carboxylesterase